MQRQSAKETLISHHIERTGRANVIADAIIASASLVSALGISGMDGRAWDDHTATILLRRLAQAAVAIEVVGHMVSPATFRLYKSTDPVYEGQTTEQTEPPPFYPLPPMLINPDPFSNLLALSAAGGGGSIPMIAREGVPA